MNKTTDHDPEECWLIFRQALDHAVAKVSKCYFEVDRYDDVAAWRERAYCYEVYHQLRLQLGDLFPYTIHGEIDKAGHEWVVKEFGKRARPNPDFILHIPDTRDNLAIIEVKISDSEMINGDLEKITKFMGGKLNYQHGIMLLFGSAKPQTFNGFPNIEILWHSSPGRPPKYLGGIRAGAPKSIRVNPHLSVHK
jgi:hypothetical protein